MNQKTLAIISYVSIIGWLIAYFQYKNREEKNSLVRYHLGQSLGVVLLSVMLNIGLYVIVTVAPALGTLMALAGVIPLILMILGIITAAGEQCKPIPVIGKALEGRFVFLN
ncbi:DUF4870 domain-containing protein [Chitinophaga pendula]|uniref:import component protein n=1 Tax=Chitinophaga TaxID=79328 RepID=UPI000BB0BCD6|nr:MULTISPECIES: import component protein [Chitinophaga]ASZ14855.1 import component protein [Chitinophaga sp. MD30]UCJ06101.1 DUF4870 domain-containing protein [Chitinophaga pendula]